MTVVPLKHVTPSETTLFFTSKITTQRVLTAMALNRFGALTRIKFAIRIVNETTER